MSDRPFTLVRNIFRKSTSESKELYKYVFEKIDGVSLWIIGLSIGSIAVLASKLTERNNLLTATQIKFIFCVLFISVACGVFYRIIYVWYYILIDGAFRQIEIALSDLDLVDTEFELDGTESFEELIRLNKQFQNLEYLLELYNKSSDTYKAQLYSDMVELYRTETRIAKQELDLSFSTVEEAYKNALGVNINLRNISPLTSKKIVRRIKIFRVVCVSLYLIFVIAFLVALGYFLFVVRLPTSFRMESNY